MHLKFIVVALALSAVSVTTAQTKHPDFSGQWQQDIEASKALTEAKGLPWRVAGAGSSVGARAGGSAIPPGANVMSPVTTITQSETEIILERKLDGEVLSRDVYKLNGALSVNASRNTSSRSTTSWKGAALVTTGTTEIDLSDDNAVVNGKPITNITRTFTLTRSLMPDGSMRVENRITQNGEERVSWAVLVRVKSS
jgi:hypothetical protein